MRQKISPGMVVLVIAAAVVVILGFAWRMLAPRPAPSNGMARLRRSGQPSVTRGPDGRLQFSPEARAQRGPSAQPPGSNAGPPR